MLCHESRAQPLRVISEWGPRHGPTRPPDVRERPGKAVALLSRAIRSQPLSGPGSHAVRCPSALLPSLLRLRPLARRGLGPSLASHRLCLVMKRGAMSSLGSCQQVGKRDQAAASSLPCFARSRLTYATPAATSGSSSGASSRRTLCSATSSIVRTTAIAFCALLNLRFHTCWPHLNGEYTE